MTMFIADFEEMFNDIDNETAGKMIKAMVKYHCKGEIPSFLGIEKALWGVLKDHLDRQEAYAVEQSRKRKKTKGEQKETKGEQKETKGEQKGNKSQPPIPIPIPIPILREREKSTFQDPPTPQGKRPRFKPSFTFIENKEWRELWEHWVSNKSSPYRKQTGVETGYKNLLKLSSDDLEEAREIIDQSIGNEWAGLFQLKTNGNGFRKDSVFFGTAEEANFEL